MEVNAENFCALSEVKGLILMQVHGALSLGSSPLLTMNWLLKKQFRVRHLFIQSLLSSPLFLLGLSLSRDSGSLPL